jgi:ribosome-associated translation inhibitor RaiA
MMEINNIDVVLNMEEFNRLVHGKVITLHHPGSHTKVNLILSNIVTHGRMYTSVNHAEDKINEPLGLYEREV